MVSPFQPTAVLPITPCVEIGDRVVVQLPSLLGRVGTIVEIEDEDRVGVRLDPGGQGGAVVWCRLRDLLPLK
jgi:hypothetical protein